MTRYLQISTLPESDQPRAIARIAHIRPVNPVGPKRETWCGHPVSARVTTDGVEWCSLCR